MAKLRKLTYNFAYVRRETVYDSPKKKLSIDGAAYLPIVFDNDVQHPTYKNDLGFDQVVYPAYTNLGDDLTPATWGAFGQTHLYTESLNLALARLFAAERAYVGTWSDFADQDGDEHLVNFLTATSAGGIPYTAIRLAVDSKILTQDTSLMLQGGTDGTMDLATLDAFVSAELDNYGDDNHPYSNSVLHPQTQLVDTGFGSTVKQKFYKFLKNGRRAVILSTYIFGQPALSNAQETSMGRALLSQFDMVPDSTWFNTPCFSYIIVKGSGISTVATGYRKRVPNTIEYSMKLSALGGADSGQLNAEKAPDIAQYSVLDYTVDVMPQWTPASTALTQYSDSRLVQIEPFEGRQLAFTQQRTGYPYQNSVLQNVYACLIAIPDARKMADRVFREFRPTQRWSPQSLVDHVNARYRQLTSGRYGSILTVVPGAFISDADNERGYSYTFDIKCGINPVVSAATLRMGIYRMSDLASK